MPPSNRKLTDLKTSEIADGLRDYLVKIEVREALERFDLDDAFDAEVDAVLRANPELDQVDLAAMDADDAQAPSTFPTPLGVARSLIRAAAPLEWLRDQLTYLDGAYSGPRKGALAKGKSSKPTGYQAEQHREGPADCRWQQGNLVLSLRHTMEDEFVAILVVEGDVDQVPARLFLIDAGPYEDPATDNPGFKEYLIESRGDGTYRVQIPSGTYHRRMRAIGGVMKRNDDVEPLLPIVEMTK